MELYTRLATPSRDTCTQATTPSGRVPLHLLKDATSGVERCVKGYEGLLRSCEGPLTSSMCSFYAPRFQSGHSFCH
ncbi:hypothetical protein HBI60_241320 [Parastagonospora nodorum]|nr:hypothetical protein HBI60_241320 [Parastagonospora nodorum]